MPLRGVLRPSRLAWALVLAFLGAASPARAYSLIGTSTENDPINTASKYYTHYANGHYWVIFDHGGIPGCILYSSPDGATWTSQGGIFAGNNPVSFTNEWSMRYLGNTVIVAAYNAGNRTYRSGTLNSNGTVTWSAESPAGPADATFPSMNLLIANGRPIMWRDDNTAGGAGAIWRGSAIVAPTWTKTAANAPAMSVGPAPNLSNGIFSGGALFPTGGANPDDLIVLRATTAGAPTANSHRLVAMKWTTDTYDPSWYNVSTLGGTIPGGENATTEVQVNVDNTNQKIFAAVRDSLGNIHAVYVNRNGDMVHYKKLVGFNDSWSRISAGINLPAENVDMLSLTALSGGNLYLFYSKTDKIIYYRRFDGTTWGPESLLVDVSATDLKGALAPMESSVDCAVGLAFTEGSASPFNVRFTLGVGSCSTLQASKGPGTLTVTGPGSFEMTFDQFRGGSLANFYDLAEDPTRTYDLAGKPSANVWGLFHSAVTIGGTQYVTGTNNNGAKLDLLEATPTRVRVRQELFFQTTGTTILGGMKAVGDYSVYPERVALRWNRRTTAALSQSENSLEIAVRREVAPDPRDTLNSYSETSAASPAPATDNFILGQREVPNVRTDFLAIMNEPTGPDPDWSAADVLNWNITSRYHAWRDQTVTALPAGTGPYSQQAGESWNFLIYYKPTSFLTNADPAVTSRSNDFRGPSTLSVGPGGGPWLSASENTGGGDDFNEAEAAYPLTLDPAVGLTFRIDGSALTPRYHPFFKIRQWRSLAGPPSVTLQGTPLTDGVDYRAAVKPLSRAHFARAVAWHSTLQGGAAVTAPDVGGAGTVNGTTSFSAGRYGNAALFDAAGESVSFGSGSGNFDKMRGALEFWYRPSYAHTDGVRHVLWQTFGDATHYMVFEKTAGAGNQLLFSINNGGVLTEIRVASTDYRWAADDWVHLRATWDATAALANQLHIVVNGVEPPHTVPAAAYDDTTMTVGTNYIGNASTGTLPASGLIDEFHVYIGPQGPLTPTPLAEGGLTSSVSEYMGDSSKNFLLDLNGVSASGQGRYLYLGADSQFRGLNVGLAELGGGVAAGDVDWEYWDGTDWVTMESGFGFTDLTSSFTRTGNLYWNDLFNWAPYSVNGGPDLYYVRAFLKTGTAYAPAPREGLITTDILLFQYCGDITAAAQEFVFAAPIPTAVELSSFTASGADGAVDLAWSTASELDNLGFHVYRADSAEGPYARITSALMPGLGSSPTGASYAYRDLGLENGRTYYYELEDVETTGRRERHGPVWATPIAGGSGEGDPAGEGEDAGSEGSAGDWTPRADASGRIVYGRPEEASYRVVERGASHVVVELLTPGFYAVPEAEGGFRLEVPGFDSGSVPGAPAVAVKRAFVAALAGRRVRLTQVEASEGIRFEGLPVAAAGAPAVEVTSTGMVRPGQKRLARSLASGPFPRSRARILEVSFQGETKKARLELAPLRYDTRTQVAVLSERMLVRLDFSGSEPRERGIWGSRGRRPLVLPRARSRGVVAELVTKEAGLHAVRYEEIFRWERGVLASSLRLSRLGEAVAYHLEPERAVFGPGSTLYFVSEGAKANPWGDTVYTLETGKTALVMPVLTALPSGPSALEYLDIKEWEENRLYQAALLEAPDLWLWDLVVSPARKDYPFTLSELSPGSTPALLTVWLQGGSDFEADPDHHVRLLLNGQMVGEATWDARTEKVIEVEVLPGILREGGNTLGLENVGDTGAAYSMVFLNRFSLRYPRRLLAENGTLRGSFAESGTAEVGSLSPDSFVLDTEEGPQWLRGLVATSTGVSFRAEGGRSYLVTARSAVRRPAVRPVAPSTLRSTRQRVDWLLIAPQEFLPIARPLIALRNSQGLRVKAVSIEEIDREFGFGEKGPQSIKDFLAYAYQSWRQPSFRYVLLLGDGSYDPKDYLRTGVKDRLSPYMTKTSYLWTASDAAYAAVNGEDLLPDVAVGRLSAGTIEEARILVEKTVAFEMAGRNLGGRAVLIADNADRGGSFEADADEVASAVLPAREVEKVYLRDLGAGTRATIVDAFDRGPALVSYAGHGGTAVWASENIFNNTDLTSLGAQDQQPLLLTLNCLNGFFHFPPFDSLAEAFVKAEGKGAIAAFAPSGLSLNQAAHVYHKALLAEIESGRHLRLGDALLAAQSAYADSGERPELLSIYHLLGDPALKIR